MPICHMAQVTHLIDLLPRSGRSLLPYNITEEVTLLCLKGVGMGEMKVYTSGFTYSIHLLSCLKDLAQYQFFFIASSFCSLNYKTEVVY